MKIYLKKNKILIIILAIFLFFFLNFYQTQIKNFFYSLSQPFQKFFWEIGEKLSDFKEVIFQGQKLKKENEKLLSENRRLLQEIFSLKELKKENEFLRKALEIGLNKEFKLTLVEIISKDISEDSFLINKGSKDGLVENLPVITQEKVLVGKIKKVYSDYSKVILISHKESSFDGKIVDKDIQGLVKGKGNFEIIFDFVPQEKEISQGDLVITSSLGRIFPKNLLVGEIKEVEKSDTEPFQKAKILPAFNFKDLKFLFVIQ